MQLTKLGPEHQRCLKDYLDFFERHRASLLPEVERVSAAAAAILDVQGAAGGEPAAHDTFPPSRSQRTLAEISTRCGQFVDGGGKLEVWLTASLAVRKSVLAVLRDEGTIQIGEEQSILLGLGITLDVATAAVAQRIAEGESADAPFRIAFEAAPTGMVIVDRQGLIVVVNCQIEQLFGYGRQELIGQPIELLVPVRFREAHRRHRGAFAESPTSRMMGVGRDLYGLRKDGSEFPVEIGLNPSSSATGLSILAVIADISERKRTQEALVAKMSELQRSNEELEQFAYVASHDMQEPLRMVVSYATLLSERYQGKLDEKADKFIRYAVEGATRMQHLVADLLTYSRVGSQGRPLKPVNAQAVLEKTIEGMRKTIDDSAAKVTYDQLPMVNADSVQLAQLFQNLISNALKFHREEPPRIHIAAKPAEDKWRFSVQDNGIGIESEHHDRIFQMFQRLHERGKYDGSGIGLTIAKKIIERHRGRIWFESQLGQGTTFFFTLPTAAREGK